MNNYQGRRMPSVDATRFAMVPGTDVPRSQFTTQHRHKTTFDMGYLIPILCREILPGDVWKINMTHFARLATMLFPIMDSVYLETFGFFTPNRILWTNWVKMMGEQTNPGDSISYTVPYVNSGLGGFANLSVADYFGIPGVGQIAPDASINVNAMPFRAHNRIFNDWFRDENLQNSVPNNVGDGPDNKADYGLYKRNKRADYFTKALPAPQKTANPVTMPMAGRAPVSGIGLASTDNTNSNVTLYQTSGTVTMQNWSREGSPTAAQHVYVNQDPSTHMPIIYAELSGATGPDINAFRLAMATQSFLEKQARGGTRYTEILTNHFRVHPEDWRLQRPEFIGGGRSVIDTHAIAQTSETTTDSPLGNLGATSTVSGNHRFQYHAKEHGWIIIYANVRAELTYQQGLHKQFSRFTQLDHYWPSFALLGEQAVLLQELYVKGNSNDSTVFGYQERWSEYRTNQSMITGLFRSTSTGNIDEWHLAQQFTSPPTLSEAFVQENVPFDRVAAAGSLAAGLQVIFDSQFDITMTRPLPMFSVPSTLGRF